MQSPLLSTADNTVVEPDEVPVAEAVAGRVPNLFIGGTQKAGTTFLSTMLAHHPDVVFSKPKEPFFFSKPNLTGKDYQGYVKTYFGRKKSDTANAAIFAEGSTTYFQSRVALGNMKRFVGGDFKMIVVLRHPVQKAISYYMHMYQRRRFESSKSILDKGVVRTSLYAPHARRWIDELGFGRFLPMKYDLLRESPFDFVNTAARFAGLEPVTRVPRVVINGGIEIVRRGDYIEPRQDLGIGPQPRFSMKELAELQALFVTDIRRTEAITGLDLGRWKQLPDFPVDADAGGPGPKTSVSSKD